MGVKQCETFSMSFVISVAEHLLVSFGVFALCAEQTGICELFF